MNHKRFTLVEIIAVISVIVILCGIAVGGYSYAMNASKESATRSLIGQLESAFEAARAKHGFYPPADKAHKVYLIAVNSGTREVDNVLVKKVFNLSSADINNAQKPLKEYMDEVNKHLDIEALMVSRLKKETGSNLYYLTDGWGNPIYYVSPGIVNTDSFDLISCGNIQNQNDAENFNDNDSYTKAGCEEKNYITNF